MSKIFTKTMTEIFLNEAISKNGYTFDYDPISGGFITNVQKKLKCELLESTPVAAPSPLTDKMRKKFDKIPLLEFVIYLCEKMDESGIKSWSTNYDYNGYHYTFSLKGEKIDE
jgi:hypothetical protein